MRRKYNLESNLYGKLVGITFAIVFCTVMIVSAATISVAAANTDGQPVGIDNLWGSKIRTTYMEPVDQGYMRVFFNYSANKVNIEYYDQQFKLTGTKVLAMELPIWGGFYKGSDAYYLVEGENNEKCVDNTEVVRIIKYDMSWNRIGAGKVLAVEGWDYEIRYPFNYSCVNMTETGGKLYVITGREGYVDPKYGQGHQGMMLIRMDESSFDTEIVRADFWHSFAQYIDSRGSSIYLYEQSEGNRCTLLTRLDANSADPDYDEGMTDSVEVLKYGGERTSAWAIPCNATVDDVSLSSDNVLGIGTSIDQSSHGSDNVSYNIYLTVTPFSDFSEEATQVKWLTSNNDQYTEYSGVSITKVNDDRFLVAWEECGDTEYKRLDESDLLSDHRLHYVFIDGAGNKLTKVFTQGAAISDCHPVICGSNAVYCASTEYIVNFYAIDTETGAFSKKLYQFIEKNSIRGATVKKIADRVYTGKAVKPHPTVDYDYEYLKEGYDYTLSYKNNKSVGTATVIIKGIGYFKGTISKTFKIVPKGTKITKVSGGKKSLTVKWKLQKQQTSGYQIQCAKNAKFTKGKKTKTIKSNKTASKTIKKLTAKKKYYVRVRTFKKVSGKTYYSPWSPKKTVKVK